MVEKLSYKIVVVLHIIWFIVMVYGMLYNQNLVAYAIIGYTIIAIAITVILLFIYAIQIILE